MAESFAISRSHLMYGVCLPLAVLVGYFLASPLDSDSQAVVILVLSVLSVPILMRWHHPLLIFSWNAPIFMTFLPGGLTLCQVMVTVSLFFSLLNRSMGQNMGFFEARSVAKSLVFLAGVTILTAWMTGGMGVRALGASSFGGKKYIYLLIGVLGYFALAVHRIPRERAHWYVGLFLLSGIVMLLGYLAEFAGPGGDFLHGLLPTDQPTETTLLNPGITRFGNVNFATVGIFSYMLMRYGIRGVFDLLRPWRMLLMIVVILASLFGGFRSVLALYFLVFVSLFYWEGLLRTRFLAVVVLAGILGAAAFLPMLQKFPLSVQRTLSFLPLNVDPAARDSAEASTQWRLDMWAQLLPEVPKYLLKGKGYAMNPDEMFEVYQDAMRGYGKGADFAMFAGDYHSGPLSIIIPFGLLGIVAFVWFSAASLRLLHQNWLLGDPALKRINTFLLAFFIARLLFFILVFGSISSDLITFTGLVGLSVSINGGRLRSEQENLAVQRQPVLQTFCAR